MFRSFILAASLAVLPSMAVADTYAFDPGHTEVRFFWDHAGVSEQSGEWGKVEGTVDFDPEDVTATKISVTIDPDSVTTGVKALDKHMKSADMFDVETYEAITFESTSAVQSGKNTLTVTGDLTIKDKTHPLTLDVTLLHMGEHPVGKFIDYYKGEWLGVKASGRLLRSEYGVGYAAPLTSDLIRIEIATELKAE